MNTYHHLSPEERAIIMLELQRVGVCIVAVDLLEGAVLTFLSKIERL
jgi:hypothetical protein